jgi:hypothetical protein
VRKEEVTVGARIRVKNGEAVRALLNGTAPTGTGRAPFSVWPPGEQMHGQPAVDGEEFEVVLAPRRKKPIYSHHEVSAQFVSVKRVSDGALLETFYVSVRFDAVPA